MLNKFFPFHPLNVYPLLDAVASVPYVLSYVTDLLVADGFPPFPSYVTVYEFAVQFAVYDLFPVLPFAIFTLFCGVVPLEPVQPVNVYPVLVGSANVISLLSVVYDVGFPDAFVPPSNVYEIV